MITQEDYSKEIERCAFDVKNSIEDVADFPIPGVIFKDLGPLWMNASLSKRAIKALVYQVESTVGIPDCVVGIESRGFIFGPAMALHWGVPFVPFRKPGKLPGAVRTVSYDLEYGSAELQCQAGSFAPQMKVLIHDDVLATGGTANAAVSLVQSFSAVVSACSFLIELEALDARKNWTLSNEDTTCLSLVKYK
tara:strand:- start:2806 stop:3384 length:579 start_codon:yes stop_codon:yes gene_type:complete